MTYFSCEFFAGKNILDAKRLELFMPSVRRSVKLYASSCVYMCARRFVGVNVREGD